MKEVYGRGQVRELRDLQREKNAQHDFDRQVFTEERLANTLYTNANPLERWTTDVPDSSYTAAEEQVKTLGDENLAGVIDRLKAAVDKRGIEDAVLYAATVEKAKREVAAKITETIGV